MRLYTFGNYYMSSIQQGIQAGHCIAELFVKYQDTGINYCDDSYNASIEDIEHQEKHDELFDWAENHKTMICLNGGNLQGLKDIEILFQDEQNKFPWATFYEDEMSLGGILTNVAIVVPEYIYENAAKVRTCEYEIKDNQVLDNSWNFVCSLSDFEVKLIDLLNSCQLAK